MKTKHILGFAITLAALFALIVGCNDDSNPAPVGINSTNVSSIELRVANNQIRGFAGDLRTETITAIARDADGVAIPEAEITFAIQNPQAWKGTITPVDGNNIADENGELKAEYSIVIESTFEVNISARSGTISNTAVISVIVVDDVIGSLSIEATDNVLSVPPNQTRQTEVTAFLADVDGNALPGMELTFRTFPSGLGFVDAETGITDYNGRVTRSFTSVVNKYGQCDVFAEVGDNIGKTTINVQAVEAPANIDLASQTPVMRVPEGENAVLTIEAYVTDSNRVGVPNTKVDFQILPYEFGAETYGSLSAPDSTNSEGYIAAKFTSLGNYGKLRVRAIVLDNSSELTSEGDGNSSEGNTYKLFTGKTAGTDGVEISDEIVIEIINLAESTGTLELSTDKAFIYADNGLTFASLTALLSDEDGQVLANAPIVFTKTHGTVNSPVVTDTNGIARAVFRDVGMPSEDEFGNPAPAIITAKYAPLGLEASVEITIRERNPVASISLRSATEQMIAGSSDSTSVRATCILMNGGFAPEGTLVRFETDMGYFANDAVPVTGNYGVAETYYIAGNLTGTAVLRAYVFNDDIVLYSNEVPLQLLPGPPARVTVTATPDHLVTNDPASYATILAIVTDQPGNPVAPSTLVRFSTTLGNITPTSITDADGHAEVRLTPGVSAGQAELKAVVQTPSGEIEGHTTVTISSGMPNSIQLSASPLHIAVSGTGGITTSSIKAEVKDANGNLVETPTTVVFELVNELPEPQGCNFNDRGQRDSALTLDGQAIVSLNAGTQVGGKLIRAYTWRDDRRREIVQASLPTVAVVSGPPHSLDIDCDDDGTDAQGGAWRIEVSARVFDVHHNPVADNIPVVFTVQPDIATISAGFTGNEGKDGLKEPGLAYANLVYQSSHTFEHVTITAEVASPQVNIRGTNEHTLPLQMGVLELHVDPINWMFYFDRPNDPNLHKIWVVLKDGHQIEIDGAPILFTTSRGKLHWYNKVMRNYTPFAPEPARMYTGRTEPAYAEEQGQATVYLRGVMNDYFLDEITPSETLDIEAAVEGYPDVVADPGFIYITRRN